MQGCREHTVSELFEKQVSRHPDAIAVVSERASLTYADVNVRANRLARHLRRLDVGPESLVGVCLERSPELIVSLLAVLKAGGAYVPMDPRYPAERLSHMVEDAQLATVVCDARTLAALPPCAARIVAHDLEHAAIAAEDEHDPVPLAVPDNLAYVIYTSGSTGRPKGAQLTHRGLANLCAAQPLAIGLTASSRVLQFSSPSFDASVWEIFPALLCGASVAVADREDLLGDLAGVLERMDCTVVTLPPTALEKLDERVGHRLEAVIAAGEAAAPGLLGRWARHCRAYNAYGPTETTVCATVEPCVAGQRSFPIGDPVAGMQVSVLDPGMVPAGVGVVAELFVGGAGVARGYMRRPGLTAERFVPDPSGGGGRLYRTGDLVRRGADGGLQFVGRADDQVKVRGFRVELGEIEAALVDDALAKEAAVVARGPSAERHLVAFIVRGGAEFSVSGLRAALGRRLPEHMVPSAFVELDALPLTPNGKIDRKALVELEYAALEPDREHVPPSTSTERTLVAIWERILGVSPVGVEDDFYELGGHSLLASRMVARAREELDVELSLRAAFEQPTVRALALLAESTQERAADGAPQPLVPVPRTAQLPASFAQERLWFLDRLAPGSPAHSVSGALLIEGELDDDALARALDGLVARHESLRTGFSRSEEGDLVQVIRPPAAVPRTLVDLSRSDGQVDMAAVHDLARTEIRRAFDLEHDLPLRATLIHLAAGQRALLLVVHHIACDAWSMGVLMHDLGALYAAATDRAAAPLAPLGLQYADYSVWHRALLSGALLERQLQYWREQLAGLTPFELPTDRPRPPVASTAGDAVVFELPRELADALRDLGRREGVTLYMALLAAFQVLLSRRAGTTDVVVGSPIAGRPRAELENLVGFFVNTMVMRGDLSGDPTFRELLARTRERALGAFDNQDLPFQRLVTEMQPQRDLSRHPIVQVAFAVQNALIEPPDLGPGTSVRELELETTTSLFDLELHVYEVGHSLRCRLIYNSDLFERGSAERLADGFARLLQAVIADPDARASEVEVVGDAERDTVLDEWSRADAPAVGGVVHEMVADWARRTPEATAVSCGEARVTFAQLDLRAARLASVLSASGVGPESLVGVCVDRSVEMVVALLAVLKAGGAYVPLDPAWPAERLGYMLADSGVAVVVCDDIGSALVEHAVDGGVEIVAVAAAAGGPPSAAVEVDGRNVAYVVYTSGSTGRPKGTAVEHASVVASTAARPQFYGSRMRSFLLLSSIAFDSSVAGLFWALTTGGELVIAPTDHWHRIDETLELIERHGVSHLLCVPSLYAAMLTASGTERLRGLDCAIMAGEPPAPALVARHYDVAPGVRLVNEYGPTEATVWSTAFDVTDREDERSVPVGRPVAGARTYVLDGALVPVGVGVVGELFVGGAGVARGYLGRPDLTAARFVPDPFDRGGRLYRTGDLARWRADGVLEFVGRVDDQVKVRGFRVELGEIETTLARHPSVRETVAAVREGATGARLSAYLVANADHTPDVSELRAFAGQFLADYMVPSEFVVLDELPRTPNGKVDRRALGALEHDALAPSGHVDPRTPTERRVAQIWRDVLEIPVERPFSIEHNFFDLGGHSLALLRMGEQLRELSGQDVPVTALFAHPTVGDLAAYLAGDEADRRSASGEGRARQDRRRERRRHDRAAQRRSS